MQWFLRKTQRICISSTLQWGHRICGYLFIGEFCRTLGVHKKERVHHYIPDQFAVAKHYHIQKKTDDIKTGKINIIKKTNFLLLLFGLGCKCCCCCSCGSGGGWDQDWGGSGCDWGRDWTEAKDFKVRRFFLIMHHYS